MALSLDYYRSCDRIASYRCIGRAIGPVPAGFYPVPAVFAGLGAALFQPMSPGCECPLLGETTPPPGFLFPPGPFSTRPVCEGLALATVRAFPGVEDTVVARASGIENGHVGDALATLEREGLARSETRTLPWYYDTRRVRLWHETPRRELLGKSLPRFDSSTVVSSPDRIPPRFWCLFWSGLDPMFIRLPEHAWYVASRMLAPKGSWRHLPAETWALQHLPVWALEKLLEGRGYADGPVAERIRLAVSRAAVA